MDIVRLYRISDSEDRTYAEAQINVILSDGWEIKQILTIPAAKDVYATLTVVFTKRSSSEGIVPGFQEE